MIQISTTIEADVDTVWDAWNDVSSVVEWAFASDDWAAEGIENNVEVGGTFRARNFAKDGSMEFMMEYVYDQVEPKKLLAYTMGDGRKVRVEFSESEGKTTINQAFDPESIHSEEQQREGWQAYLNNFKAFVEKSSKGES